MKPNQAAAALTFAATLLAAGSAVAAGPTNAEHYPFPEAATPTHAAGNGAAMKPSAKSAEDAKTMGAPRQSWTDDRSREIQMYLKAGG
ncbi:MAG: hypothetical protein NDJ19_15770 [Ramlibacter sp.]|nr:hypothetical protein [Ramlibacter sp.]